MLTLMKIFELILHFSFLYFFKFVIFFYIFKIDLIYFWITDEEIFVLFIKKVEVKHIKI